jgi:tetratricopeptide (TPR) repeat protein
VALLGLADAHRHLGRPDEARTLVEQALTLAEQAGYRLLEGQAIHILAGVHLAQGRPDLAVKYAQDALDIHRETGYRLGQARSLALLTSLGTGDSA